MEIIPAILEKDLSEIQAKLKRLEPHFKKAQIDIGDGRFVLFNFKALNKFEELGGKIALEVHLMTKKPWEYLKLFAKPKFEKITFHYEAFHGVKQKTRSFAINNFINQIQSKGIKAGIAINPETPASHISEYLKKIDEVLLLAVNPGRQGQKFMPAVLGKVNFLRNFRKNLIIGIDGGINDENIESVKIAGIDNAYIGSFLWKEKNLAEAIKKLK